MDWKSTAGAEALVRLSVYDIFCLCGSIPANASVVLDSHGSNDNLTNADGTVTECSLGHASSLSWSQSLWSSSSGSRSTRGSKTDRNSPFRKQLRAAARFTVSRHSWRFLHNPQILAGLSQTAKRIGFHGRKGIGAVLLLGFLTWFLFSSIILLSVHSSGLTFSTGYCISSIWRLCVLDDFTDHSLGIWDNGRALY